MKKTIFIAIILLVTIVFMSIPNFSYSIAVPMTGPETNDGYVSGLGDLDDYRGENPNSEKLTSMVGNLLGGIRAVGTVVSVVILIGIGIKYMLASVAERADYKKALIPYIIGAAILFTGTTIPQLIYKLVNQL